MKTTQIEWTGQIWSSNIMVSTSVYEFENENSQVCATAISAHTGIPAKSIECYLSDLKHCSLIVYKGFQNITQLCQNLNLCHFERHNLRFDLTNQFGKGWK